MQLEIPHENAAEDGALCVFGRLPQRGKQERWIPTQDRTTRQDVAQGRHGWKPKKS